MEYITKMEEITGMKFGDKQNPLLVSVRSGARALTGRKLLLMGYIAFYNCRRKALGLV